METELYEILGKHFRNEISPEEKLILDKWLESEENQIIYKEVEKTWILTSSLKPPFKPDVNEEWSRFNQLLTNRSPLSYLEKEKEPKVRNLKVWGLRVAAVLLIGLTVFAALKFVKPAGQIPDLLALSTTNELKEFGLPDGSIVTLNKNSTIEYPKDFSGKNRRITLTGEAFFEVVKGKGTFTVNAGKTTTTVLGTKFNIKAIPGNEQTEIYVTEGKVKFFYTGNKNNDIFLAGEQGLINNNTGELKHDKLEDINKIAWKTGNLVFNNSKMYDVQNTISEYFDKKVILEPSLNELLFTGNFEKPKLTEMLEIIKVSLIVDYQIKNDTILISTRN